MLRRTIAAAMLLGTGVSQADEPGFYVGVGVGQSKVSDSELGLSFDGDDTAFKLFGGYRINPNISAELTYIDIGTPSDTIQGIDLDIEADIFQASLLGMWPFSDTLSGYLRAGVLFWDATATASNGFNFVTTEDDGNDFSWGAGIEFGGGNLRGRFEYEGSDVEGTDLKLISLSAVYRF